MNFLIILALSHTHTECDPLAYNLFPFPTSRKIVVRGLGSVLDPVAMLRGMISASLKIASDGKAVQTTSCERLLAHQKIAVIVKSYTLDDGAQTECISEPQSILKFGNPA